MSVAVEDQQRRLRLRLLKQLKHQPDPRNHQHVLKTPPAPLPLATYNPLLSPTRCKASRQPYHRLAPRCKQVSRSRMPRSYHLREVHSLRRVRLSSKQLLLHDHLLSLLHCRHNKHSLLYRICSSRSACDATEKVHQQHVISGDPLANLCRSSRCAHFQTTHPTTPERPGRGQVAHLHTASS